MIAALLTLIAGIGGALSSLTSVPMIGGIIALLGTRAGRYLMVGGASLLIYGFGYWKGESAASVACEADALRAKLAAAEIDRGAANERAARSQLVINGLQMADEANRRRIGELTDELARLPLQSTKPGAKADAKALLDDQCRYTRTGARRLRK